MIASSSCNFSAPIVVSGGDVVPLTSSTPDGTPFQFQAAACETEYVKATSSDQLAYNGFTYGEIIISVLLFFALVIIAYAFLWFTTRGVKIQQKL